MITKKFISRIAVLLAASLLLTSTFTACKSKPAADTSSTTSAASSDLSSSENSGTESSQAASAISIAMGNSANSSKKAPAVSYSSKSYFNSAAKKVESKIGINNKSIVAPSIASSAPAASIIKRTTIEGIDGSFIDPVVNESPRDLGGKTYTFATFWPQYWQGGKNATKDAARCSEQLANIQKDYNCKIKINTLDVNAYLKNITAARAAGKVYADIFQLAIQFKDTYLNGNCADLLTVNSVNIKGNQWNPIYTLETSFKNKVYGAGLRYDYIGHDLILFNKTLAAKYNLGNFYDMVDSGQWTADMFLQICQQFKKSNSDKSIYAIEGLQPPYLLDFVYTNWTSPFGITDQKYIFNGTDSSVLNMLDYCQTIVKDGLYDTTYDPNDFPANGLFPSFKVTDHNTSMPKFVNNKALFFLTNDNTLDYFNTACKSNFGILPMPKGPSADGYTSLIGGVIYFSLLTGNPDNENAGALLTAMANRTNIKTADIIANSTSFVRDQQSVTTLTNCYKYKQIFELSLSDNFNDCWRYAALNSVLRLQSTPKEAMDSIAKSAQAYIDKDYGQ